VSPGERDDLLEEADAICDLIAELVANHEKARVRLRTTLAALQHLRAAIAATDAAWDEKRSLGLD
jgi:hypothetical protein